MFYKNKKILITGGTGTIGKSILKYLLKEQVQYIKIFSRDEYKQQQLQSEIGYKEEVRYVIGDIREYESVLHAMEDIDYVFHLAAMKRVDACEMNPDEAVKTNIHGTKNVIRGAIAQSVKKVIFTSSDKAISPTNTYGATKLIGEKMITATEFYIKNHSTVFASVRFGNVMGSRGSVIPLFKNKIINDKKIEVTDENMTRFMMTLVQATNLTVKSLEEAKGGEVYVLKMPVIKLGDLANILVEEVCEKYGFNQAEIEVEVTGLKPGEKWYEELMTYDESKLAWELDHMFFIPGFTNSSPPRKAKKALHGTYSSSGKQALSIEELRMLLKEAGLI
ncbi:SDR family NAD(P)-dependent oxidoreductase [Halalkalibacillus halophilus]|uniref:SDR family NAD(P)-dependent oxidoreductase n=1 Tax=Halalkalibacillus halophilus TaxID=392827 RepID=UPI00041D38F1|nr:SDR family NAD(P)-dependent oxidoreductase [Halalkalibacillus halophilus]